MANNTDDIRFGPMASVQISGSFGTITDVGYLQGADITFEPQPIPLNGGQQFDATGLGKCEVRLSQTDNALVASCSLMKVNGGEIQITDISGNTYTCGPALCSVMVSRPFEASEGHFITLSMTQAAVSESGFLTIA